MKKWMQLAGASLAIGLVWLVLLPRLSDWSPVRRHIETMRAADIQVDAMFYSELSHVPGL
jgi:hypothetical protein